MIGDHREATSQEGGVCTYDHLNSETQSLFTRGEWFLKNAYFAANGSDIYQIESVEGLGTSSEGVVEVSLILTYEDGPSSMRTTYFVYEDGEWKHAFGQEERKIFMPGVSYEEFVAAQQYVPHLRPRRRLGDARRPVTVL